jgi:hypothetical protein
MHISQVFLKIIKILTAPSVYLIPLMKRVQAMIDIKPSAGPGALDWVVIELG